MGCCTKTARTPSPRDEKHGGVQARKPSSAAQNARMHTVQTSARQCMGARLGHTKRRPFTGRLPSRAPRARACDYPPHPHKNRAQRGYGREENAARARGILANRATTRRAHAPSFPPWTRHRRIAPHHAQRRRQPELHPCAHLANRRELHPRMRMNGNTSPGQVAVESAPWPKM